MRLLLLIFVFTAFSAQAQDFPDKVYFNKKEKEINDPKKAAYVMSYLIEEGNYIIRYIRLSDDKVIQQKSYADKAMTILDGKQFWDNEKDPTRSYVEYFKYNEPVGTWTINRKNRTVEVDYDFDLDYKIEKKDKEEKKPSSENTKPASENNKADTFKIVETMPEFPGGLTELMNFLQSNLYYSKAALDLDISGTVYCEFIIDEEGKVTNVLVAKKEHPIIDKEAARVIRMMPDWKPGTQRGKNVKVYFTVPIKFRLH